MPRAGMQADPTAKARVRRRRGDPRSGRVSESIIEPLTLHLVCAKHVLGAQGEDRPTSQVTVSTPGPPSALSWPGLGLP